VAAVSKPVAEPTVVVEPAGVAVDLPGERQPDAHYERVPMWLTIAPSPTLTGPPPTVVSERDDQAYPGK